jgi:DNA sulfur modification protein DndB
MPTNVPAMRGSFGSTEYFLLTMRVGELTTKLTVPKEMDGWDDLSPEERFQRDVNYKRVKEQIAPYLANDPDRFIGAFIVTVKNDENMIFQSFEEAGIKIPAMLGASFGSDIGILTLNGEELLIPLDGQHRLAALKFAVSGKDERGSDISNINGNGNLAKDSCSVILIRDDVEKSRKIFNKVNRYAKPTSKADNLITGDDDVCAVISRNLIVTDLIGSRLVKMGSGNTLPTKAHEFTTLSTVYEISKSYLESHTGERINTQTLPPPATVKLYEQELGEFWRGFLKVSPYDTSLLDREDSGDEIRRDVREAFLICKPIIMRALAEAFIRLQNVPEGASRLSLTDFVQRVNDIDWAPDHPQWMNVLVQPGGRVITGPAAMNLAARYIAFMLGEHLEDYALEDLTTKLAALGVALPEQAF